MPRRIVIFDTNAYADLTAEGAEELKATERGIGYVACASPIVALELLAHLADEADPDVGRALKSLRALWLHTRFWDRGDAIPFFGTARDALSRDWFGKTDPVFAQLSRHLGAAIVQTTRPAWRTDSWLREFCGHARDFVERTENHFGTRFAAIASQLRSDAVSEGLILDEREAAKVHHAFHREEGLQYAAEIIAMAIADRVGESIGTDRLPGFADRVLATMPVSAAFLRNELRRFVADGADPMRPKNLNSIWDLQHCGHVGRNISPVNTTLLGTPLPLLVTNDRGIVIAARDVDCSDLVLRFADYLELVRGGVPG